MEKTKTIIEVDRELWEKFKAIAKNKGMLLMAYLEKVIQDVINAGNDKN